jgi:hypothetical protein
MGGGMGGGMGRGMRNTMLPGAGTGGVPQKMDKETEIVSLKQQADILKKQIEEINKRIEKIEENDQ